MNYSIGSKLLYYTGLSWIGRQTISKKGKLVLMFHGVSEKKIPDIPDSVQPHLTKKEFESILCWLKNNFKFLHPNELMDSNKNGLLLTFDDGFHNNFSNVFPILKEHNIPGLFFITTQHVKNPNDWLHFVRKKGEKYLSSFEQNEHIQSDLFKGISKKNLSIMASNPLITIGSHTVSHPSLSKCSLDKVMEELTNSKIFLQKTTGQSIDYFAYPSGDYDLKVINAVENTGYKLAFGIDKIKNLGRIKFEIPRIGIYSSEIPYLAAKLSGLYSGPIAF
tara:strand:- start:1013 stop:1843 length:831 start_codon:yes stop_codon:yes gene_type:complete